MLKNWLNVVRDLPMEDDAATLEELAQRLAKENMTAPAILFFETMKPVGFITGQAAIVSTPLLGSFISPMRLEKYADLLADRAFVERLITRIEELDAQKTGETTPVVENNNPESPAKKR